jgi:hypothetical protein
MILVVPVCALAANRVGFVSNENFAWAFGAAAKGMNSRMKLQQKEDGSFMEKVTGVERVAIGGNQEAWKVTFNSWTFWHTGSIETFITSAVAINEGEKFQYTYYTHEVPQYFSDEITQDVTPYINKNLLKNQDDTKIDWGIDNGRIFIKADYVYDGTDRQQAKDKLSHLMVASQGLMTELIPLIDKYKERYQEELSKKDISYLDKESFIGLFANYIDFGRHEKESNGVKEGVFKLARNKTYNFHYENYGDKLIFSQWFSFPSGIFDDDRTAILDTFKAIVEKKGPPKGANSVKAELYPGSEDNAFRIVLEYDFDGSYKGKQLYTYVAESGEKYMIDMYEQANKIMDNYLEELLEKDISYLSKKLFLMAMTDSNYSEYEREMEGVKEGYFTWYWTSEYGRKLSLELYNYGDHLWFVQFFTFAADSSESFKQGIKDDTNAFLKKLGNPKHASNVYAQPCPGYEDTCLMVIVDYQFNGKFTARELQASLVEEVRNSYFLKVSVKMETIMDENR